MRPRAGGGSWRTTAIVVAGWPIVVQDQMIADANGFAPSNRFVQRTLHTSHSAPQDLTNLLIELI